MATTRTTLITGATDGHGWALADHLAGDGARLILHGRHQDKLDQTAGDLAARHHLDEPPATVLCDLADLAPSAPTGTNCASPSTTSPASTSPCGSCRCYTPPAAAPGSSPSPRSAERRRLRRRHARTPLQRHPCGRFYNQGTEARANDAAYDLSVRQRLWQPSLDLTGAPDPARPGAD